MPEPDPEATDPDPDPEPPKTKLEFEKLQLEVRKLRETVELEKKMLGSQLAEMRVGPRRTVRLSLITTAASILTTLAIGVLGFQINVAAALQRDSDTYRQLFQSIDADRPGIRASAALGLGSAFEKPTWFFAALSPFNPDRSRQSLVMLAERLKTETDPVVQLSIIDALGHVPANSESAGPLLSACEHLSRRLQKALIWSARLNLQRIRPVDLDQHFFDLIDDTALLDVPGSADTHGRLQREWYIFASRTLHVGRKALAPTSLPARALNAQVQAADVAAGALAKQRMLVGLVVTRMVNDNPALVNSEDFFADALLGVRLDRVVAPRLNWTQVFAQGSATEANFDCANFSGSDLSGLNMHGTTIRGASLAGAILPLDEERLPNLEGSDWTSSLNVRPEELIRANPFVTPQVAQSNPLYLRFVALVKNDPAFTAEIRHQDEAKTVCTASGRGRTLAAVSQ